MVENSYLHTFSQNLTPKEDYPQLSDQSLCESKKLTEITAGFGIRALAYLIDRIILSVIGIVFFIVGVLAIKTGSFLQMGITSLENLTKVLILTYATTIIIEIGYYTYFHAHTGQTVGKMVCGLKVVDAQGELISYKRAFGRWVGYVVSSVILYLGFLWIAFDRNRQGWHDKIAKTYVIKV
ncbi:MAG: RDD family protein [Pseudomonadota bacterium]